MPAHYLSRILGQPRAKIALALIGIDESHPPTARKDLPTIAFVNLCLEHARAARCESFGLAPRDVPFGTISLLVNAAAQGATFAEAVRRCGDAMRILRPDLTLRMWRGRAGLHVEISSNTSAAAKIGIGLEFFVLALHCAFRWLTGAPLRPLHLRTTTRRDGHEASLLSVLCCPVVRRGRGVTLCYSPRDAELPIRSLKYEGWAAHELPELMRLLQEAADEINWPTQQAPSIIARVQAALAQGARGENLIAARLGMSSASLRRRVAESGTSYRAILSDAQRDAVAALLPTDMPLASIAAEVGFSDVRSLRRACLRWFGMTPSERRLASGPDPAEARL